MALLNKFNFKGINLDSAYFKLSSFTWRGDNTIFITLDIYTDSNKKDILTTVHEVFTLDLNNKTDSNTIMFETVMSAVYKQLKTYPNFLTAQDV